MIRRLLSTLLVALLLITVSPSPSYAETEAQLKARLESLKRESARAGEAYSKAYWALDESNVRINRIDKRMRKTGRDLKAARARLSERANSMYRREGLDLMGFLLGADDFQALVTRFEYLGRIGKADARAIAEVEELRARLRKERTALRSERKTRQREVARLRKQRDALQARLKSKEAEFRKVKAQLDQVRSGGRPVSGGVASVPGPNGMVFPVVGSYYYSNTWGASRSGGRRRHQGTDIMAPRGTRLVAITSGTVRTKSNSLGGKTIWLSGANGWQFYYAHLDTYIVTSGRVSAGQVIGTVGSTGNAAASSPHLHLQMHPGGGGAVNPYPYLRSME